MGEPADAGGNTRNDAERHARGHERQRFLAAAPENKRIPALEPQHPPAVARKLHQPRRDILLLRRRLAAALAGIDDFTIGAGQGQRPVVDQRIVHDHFRLAQPVQGMQRQQPGIPGACARQPDPSGFQFGHIECEPFHGNYLPHITFGWHVSPREN